MWLSLLLSLIYGAARYGNNKMQYHLYLVPSSAYITTGGTPFYLSKQREEDLLHLVAHISAVLFVGLNKRDNHII